MGGNLHFTTGLGEPNLGVCANDLYEIMRDTAEAPLQLGRRGGGIIYRMEQLGGGLVSILSPPYHTVPGFGGESMRTHHP